MIPSGPFQPLRACDSVNKPQILHLTQKISIYSCYLTLLYHCLPHFLSVHCKRRNARVKWKLKNIRFQNRPDLQDTFQLKKNPQCDSSRCTEPLGGPDSAGSDSSDMVKPCFPGWANTVGDPCCKQSLTGYTQLTFINTSWGFPLVWGNTHTINHKL